jgi:hypothetical protein
MQVLGLLYAYRIPCGISKNVAINELQATWLITRGSESLLHVWHQTTPTILNPKVICEVTLSSGPSLTL